jgi:hypothetical protein
MSLWSDRAALERTKAAEQMAEIADANRRAAAMQASAILLSR